VEETVSDSEATDPPAFSGGMRQEVHILRNFAARAAAENLAPRVAAAHHRNYDLRVEMERRRTAARRRRDLLRLSVESARQACTLPALRPNRHGRRRRPAAPDPQAERLRRLHTRYETSREHADRTALLAAYDDFALGLARRFPSRREAPDDLAQVARIGLLKALDRFEPALGRPFTAFARATIVGELKRHIRDRTWSMRVPRSLQEQYLVVVRALDDLTQQQGRSPTIPELARWTDLPEEQILEAMELGGANRALSLDVPALEGDGRLLDPGSEDYGFAGVDRRALLGTLLARLSDRERQVLHLRFVEERTQAEIAQQIGVSQMYVSRLLTRTLARMRAWAN
jgi:RNA polymerase sigma-B factor